MLKMGARYYDPEVGRFISEDPIGFEGGDVNLCAYASNNPILLIDPLGLCESCESLSWGNILSHYVFGGGKDLSVSINAIYPKGGLQPSDFSGPNNTVGRDTNGPAGNVTFYNNNGEVGAYNDPFDFDPKPWGVRDPNGFPYLKEFSTRVGSWLPGTPYDIRFEGQVPINGR